jgi:hypothetical protein
MIQPMMENKMLVPVDDFDIRFEGKARVEDRLLLIIDQ